MKEKKLEWAKPVLRDLGAALTDGKVVVGACSPGAIHTYVESCASGTVPTDVRCTSGPSGISLVL